MPTKREIAKSMYDAYVQAMKLVGREKEIVSFKGWIKEVNNVDFNRNGRGIKEQGRTKSR